METKDKMGEVRTTPLKALKRLCEEFSFNAIISGGLNKFNTLCDKAVEKSKPKTKNEEINTIAMFPDGALDLAKQIMKERKETEELVEMEK